MKSAVIINLDYEHHSVQTCRRVWDEIVLGMEDAGFSRHYRLFLADMDGETATAHRTAHLRRQQPTHPTLTQPYDRVNAKTHPVLFAQFSAEVYSISIARICAIDSSIGKRNGRLSRMASANSSTIRQYWSGFSTLISS